MPLRRRDQRRRRSGARPEVPDAQVRGLRLLMQPVGHRYQPGAEQGDVEAVLARALVDRVLLRRQQVKQEGGKPSILQCRRDLPVARTEATAPAAVREDDDSRRAFRDRERPVDVAGVRPDRDVPFQCALHDDLLYACTTERSNASCRSRVYPGGPWRTCCRTRSNGTLPQYTSIRHVTPASS